MPKETEQNPVEKEEGAGRATGKEKLTQAVKKLKARAKPIPTLEAMFVLALLAAPNDLLDLLEVTGILKIVTILIDFFTAVLLFVWYFIRLRTRPGTLQRFLRYLAQMGLEFSPIGVFPWWSAGVLFEYLKGRMFGKK